VDVGDVLGGGPDAGRLARWALSSHAAGSQPLSSRSRNPAALAGGPPWAVMARTVTAYRMSAAVSVVTS